MKVLVTGAGGFVGGSLAKALCRNSDIEVIGLTGRALPGDTAPRLTWVQHDLSRKLSLNSAISDIDYIVHCAAKQDFQDCPLKKFLDINMEMTENVADFASETGVKGIIYTSSISLHGEIRAKLVDAQTDRLNPDLYGVSKFLCEQLLLEYQSVVPAIALRLCGVVGTGANNIWLSRVLADAVQGEDIQVFNSDKQFNNVVHVDDMAGFIVSLLRKGFSGFNAFPVAAANPISIHDVVAEMVKVTHSSSKIIDNGANHKSFLISNETAVKNFGYEPVDVLTCLQRYARSACLNEPG